ncbi:MAG: hypothetical protein KKB95_11660 [Gammaproteobacteria bacterium]|nr:hypothetical protein [Gammaproteobacteria bacterium]MBU0828354.1 hypothetical protein [Gammaproteobacteria bacterium]MBU0893210.1 hypothetical protein [Gammaproteobacteria bacterium]MBU1352537.1 hypothetical protein [Gammaproteobacteria bacterium]MBU1505335.1 hypothetical protein [Gammaproteobacteria bacterium]
MLDPALFSRQLTWADALRFVDQQVVVYVPAASGVAEIPLMVHSVTESPAAPGTHQFAISFQGPPNGPMAQGTYRLRHPELGDFAVFMTPMAQKADGFLYEACFSHVV